MDNMHITIGLFLYLLHVCDACHGNPYDPYGHDDCIEYWAEWYLWVGVCCGVGLLVGLFMLFFCMRYQLVNGSVVRRVRVVGPTVQTTHVVTTSGPVSHGGAMVMPPGYSQAPPPGYAQALPGYVQAPPPGYAQPPPGHVQAPPPGYGQNIDYKPNYAHPQQPAYPPVQPPPQYPNQYPDPAYP